MKKRSYKILLIAQDVGGVAAVAPVFRALKKTMSPTAVFSSMSRSSVPAPGAKYFQPSQVNFGYAKRLIDQIAPDALIVGTSGGASLDKEAMRVASLRGIPCIAIVEFNGNYLQRFAGLRRHPDRICVLNSEAKRALAYAGFDPHTISVAGNPALDAVPRGTFDGVGKALVFIDQPFTELMKEVPGSGFGYEEHQAFGDLLDALDELGWRAPVIVKWHPRTKARRKFDKLAMRRSYPVSFDAHTSLPSLLRKARLVVGMNSTALFEAALRGAPVLSYQPGLDRPDPLISNSVGISTAVYRKRQLLSALRVLLKKRRSVSRHRLELLAPRHATGRVMTLLLSLL